VAAHFPLDCELDWALPLGDAHGCGSRQATQGEQALLSEWLKQGRDCHRDVVGAKARHGLTDFLPGVLRKYNNTYITAALACAHVCSVVLTPRPLHVQVGTGVGRAGPRPFVRGHPHTALCTCSRPKCTVDSQAVRRCNAQVRVVRPLVGALVTLVE
jgi:hypothetical protein